MGYLSEFRLNWPNLLGAALGLGFGTAINHYMMNLFGPALIAEFGWTRSQFALVGSLGLVSLLFMPIAGRVTDKYGPRTAAIIGFSVVPAGYFALSLMTGNIYQFYAVMLLKGTIGMLTATMVFTRVVVDRFDRSRGLALSCLLSCPPLVGAIAAPIFGTIIAEEGWRTAYQVLALVSAVGGACAILLIGGNKASPGAAAKPEAAKLTWAEFREFARNPVFLLLLGGMFLCNLPQVIVASQMNIMLMDNGATPAFATLLVSLYAIAVVIGRFISGYSLDRVPPHLVAIVALGLPTLGYAALAGPLDMRWILAGSIALVGLAQGAETDVAAILTSRKFAMANFSFVFSILMTSMSVSSAIGSILLSVLLKDGGTFDAFLIISAIATSGGALCFFLTGRFGAGPVQFRGDFK